MILGDPATAGWKAKLVPAILMTLIDRRLLAGFHHADDLVLSARPVVNIDVVLCGRCLLWRGWWLFGEHLNKATAGCTRGCPRQHPPAKSQIPNILVKCIALRGFQVGGEWT